MIVTVSTVKDKLHNIQRYVEGNLAGGADHLVLFLDQAHPEAQEWLDGRPEVTTVVTNTDWWRGQRPGLLNRRQRVNANLARAVLAFAPWAEWLFHVDGDEVVRLDRSVLAGVPAHTRAVALQPLEVVSTLHPSGEPTQFKRLLDDDELDLVHQLRLVDEPTNSLYFRSHIAGKVGVRPRFDTWLGIHKAADVRDERVRAHRDPRLRMLHYESYSGEDFVRKWTSMVNSGPSMHFGTHRMAIAEALAALVRMDLPRRTKAVYFERIYRRYMEDPVDALDRLGLLEEVDVRRPTHTPTVLPGDERALLSHRLELLRDQDKLQFMPTAKDSTTVDVRLQRLFGAKPTRASRAASSPWRRAARAVRARQQGAATPPPAR